MRAIAFVFPVVGIAVLSLAFAGSLAARVRTMTLMGPNRPAPVIVTGAEASIFWT